MNKHETAEAIYDCAAAWVAIVDREGDDPVTQRALAGWLAEDSRRRGAYFRARAAWASLDRIAALGGGHEREGEEEPVRYVTRRGWLLGAGGLAASLAAGAVGLNIYRHRPERIETALGEIRHMRLGDGSVVAIDTSSALAVALKPELRSVAIDKGQAWFHVAKDRARPFVVAAGDVRVRAVGTAFSVRRGPDGAAVQVTEGVVEVWSTRDEANKRHLAAGASGFIRYGPAPIDVVAADVDVDRRLAWRSGQLILDGDTLADAAEEFNRYNAVKIRVEGAGLASEKLVGRFHTDEPGAFARAASVMLGAHAQIGPDAIILSRN